MTWDEYFMGMAQYISTKSKDPSTKVGCVVVTRGNQPISWGYNGFAQGVPDIQELLVDRETKLKLTLHAELNALLFSSKDMKGATLYVYPFPPCARCAAAIVQKGVRRVVSCHPTEDVLERWGEDLKLTEWQFKCAGISLDLVESTWSQLDLISSNPQLELDLP